MTWHDVVDLVVSHALWLRCNKLHESDALDEVWRVRALMSIHAAHAGWTPLASRAREASGRVPLATWRP